MDEIAKRLSLIEERLSKIEKALFKPIPLPPLPSVSSVRIDQPKIDDRVNEKKKTIEPLPLKNKSLKTTFKQNFLIGIGIFFLLCALGWFLKYVVIHNLISPSLRFAIGISLSLMVYSAGIYLLNRKPKGGKTLMVLGCTSFLLSLFIGEHFYGLPSTVSLIGTGLILLLTASIAIKKQLEDLGIACVFFALLLPIFNDYFIFKSWNLWVYVLLIDSVSLSMVHFRQWGKVFLIAWLISVLFIFYGGPNNESLIPIVAFPSILGLFLFPSVFCATYNKQWIRQASFILLLSPLVLGFWVFFYIPASWVGIACASIIVFYCTAGYFHIKRNSESLSQLQLFVGGIYAFGTVIFLLIFTKIQFINHDYIMLALFLEAFTLVAVSHYVLKTSLVTKFISLYFLVPLIELLYSMELIYLEGFDTKLLVVLIGSLSTGGAIFILKKNLDDISTLIIKVLKWSCCLLTFLTIENASQSFSESLGSPKGLMIIVLALAGLGMLFQYTRKHSGILQSMGTIFIAASFFRLFNDIGIMSMLERVIVLLIVGLLLISLAFFDVFGVKRERVPNP